MPVFGVKNDGIQYVERRAAYVVAFGDNETVAVVRAPSGRCWLPGGGSMLVESAEETIIREIREELGLGIRLIHRICDAVQFFHSVDENVDYRMQAIFYRGEFTDGLKNEHEYEMHWLPRHEAHLAFFHECHGWAVEQSLINL